MGYLVAVLFMALLYMTHRLGRANDRLGMVEREMRAMRFERVADLRAHFELGVHAGRESRDRAN
jgi:hypothetical protein